MFLGIVCVHLWKIKANVMGAKERAYLPHAVVEVTTDCNLRCKHCYNWWKREGEAPPARGAFGKAFRLLEWLISHTTAEQVVFSGGEPTLCERFEELALHAKVNGLRVTVITNGNGPGRVYEALARMGVDLLEFSVLSARAATHDGITGAAGSWERTTRELRLALDRGVEVVPVTVVTALNADGVGECLEMLCGMGVRRVMVNRYNVGGEGVRQARSLSPDAATLRRVFREVDELAGRLGLDVVSGVCTPHCLLDPEEYPHVRFGSCGTEAYRRPLTFDVEGNVRMCNHSPRVMGNVYRQPLEEILFSDYACSWESGRAAFCEECGRGERCRGGCRAAAEQVGGTLRDADPVTRELSLKPFNC